MNHNGLTGGEQTGLGVYYFLVFLLNLGFAAYWHYQRRNARQATLWAVVSGLFLFHAFLYLAHFGPVMPLALRHLVDLIMGPTTYFLAASLGFFLVLLADEVLLKLGLTRRPYLRPFFTDPITAWALL